ncbi:MAG: chromosome segregation protein SMC [Gammaproteobacteria bacterium]|nr:chromosome segregation protein SMC [Gammaproteobacteria bacterium]
MRLKKIKLAGFKSFVDPTTINLPSNLVGIVGPNGCGKSNVIDAVRWVMGESSAKHLRGDSMADVIFNGSSARKPVSLASIELMFDNSEGTAGGQYANFAEISIKRQVSRDGTSQYFLNGTRCRRKDIQDIFLGTGLGPRSYSIIEQGMISRLIEAKPEELRVFLEEAAGISKYKERRRETENRIKHTRENIERLDDLRGELEKQLAHLQRQARTAERYKEMKGVERRLKAELLALKWRELDASVGGKDREIGEKDNLLEAAVADQRSVELDIEKTREQHTEANDAFNEVQGRFYSIGSDIARIEQSIQHGKELKQRQERDLAQTEHSWQEVSGHLERDREQLEDVERALEEMEPGLGRLREAETESSEKLHQVEEEMQQWQSAWDAFNKDSSEASQSATVDRTQIEGIERQMQQVNNRIAKLEEEAGTLDPGALEEELEKLRHTEQAAGEQRDQLQQQLDDLLQDISSLREQDKELTQSLHQQRSEQETAKGRLSSLEALQQSALGKSRDAVNDWLASHSLESLPRLAETLDVDSGWERAVETVLGHHLEAVCVEDLGDVEDALRELDDGAVTLLDSGNAGSASAPGEALGDKVRGQAALPSLLAGVGTVGSLEEGLRRRRELSAGQSLITADGIWIGPNWLRVNREQDEHAGVLAREQEIKDLKQRLEEIENAVTEQSARQEAVRERLKEGEMRREDLQSEVNRAHRAFADAKAQLDSRQERQEQLKRRGEEVNRELQELRKELEQHDEDIRQARSRLDETMSSLQGFEADHEKLLSRRNEIREALEQARQQNKADREAVHELALKVESRRSMRESTQRNLERMQQQLEQLGQRREELQQALEAGHTPGEGQEDELNELLEKRANIEKELGEARRLLEDLDQRLRNLEQERVAKERRVASLREELNQLKLNSQEMRVRRQTLKEQLDETGFEIDALFEEMEEGATVASWQEQVDDITRKIDRLGPINLAAIDEYQEQSQRKEYLDAQHEDLMEALTTLENAIRKIDRETRTRFKETFEKVNVGLQKNFPKLFGGGHAYLELTGEELLDAGVTVMARPPGKRNSTIHLLSGGEKALTAVALVFSIFELNPAPFCMLDEVDAPLDDANVGRFCNMVKEMSERVQFIFITHNKTTMELSKQLTGVTMHEPGVSRLVAVDVDEAVQMAAM